MQGEIDERVPRGGHSLMTVFGLPGAALGLLFYLISNQLDSGQEQEALLLALLVGVAFGGATYLLTVLKGQVVRAALTGAGMGLFSAFLAFMAYGGQGFEMSSGFLSFLAWGTVLTVALPFVRAASKRVPFFDYRPLYADAWTLPAIVGVSQAFVLVGVLLALLVAALFAFIGLDILMDLMSDGWFILTYGGLLQAVGIGVVRQRAAAILAVRGIKMALIRVTAPVFALCAMVFVGAVMIRGFGSLIDGVSPVGTLTAAAAVAIVMINAIVADDGKPQNALFGATSRLLGLILLFLMGLAAYGLYMRIAAEGWTPNRVVAAIPVAIFTLYAPIYTVAALAERWSILRQGNIAMSAVLILVAVFICTPLFRPYDWSVQSQLAKFEAAPEEVEIPDLLFLRDRLGEPGKTAFTALAEGEERLAQLAQQVGDRPSHTIPHDEDDIEVAEITIVPETWEIPDALREAALAKADAREDVVINQLPDGTALVTILDRNRLIVRWLKEVDGEWQSMSESIFYSEKTKLLTAARAGEIGYVTQTYKLPTLGNQTLPLVAGQLEPFLIEEGLDETEEPAIPAADQEE